MSDMAIHLHVHTERGPGHVPPAIADLTGSDPTSLSARPRRDARRSLSAGSKKVGNGAAWMRLRIGSARSRIRRSSAVVPRGDEAAEGTRPARHRHQQDRRQAATAVRHGAQGSATTPRHSPARRPRRTAPRRRRHPGTALYLWTITAFPLVRKCHLRRHAGRRRRRRLNSASRTSGQGGANVTTTHVPWDRIFYDPHSRRLDSATTRATRAFVIWMDREQLEDLHPDGDDVIEASFSSTDFYYNDRPETAFWTDNNRRRVKAWCSATGRCVAPGWQHLHLERIAGEPAAIPLQGPQGQVQLQG